MGCGQERSAEQQDLQHEPARGTETLGWDRVSHGENLDQTTLGIVCYMQHTLSPNSYVDVHLFIPKMGLGLSGLKGHCKIR